MTDQIEKKSIFEYRDANPKLKQKDLVEHFNKLFVIIRLLN
jgi:hypothetical protein